GTGDKRLGKVDMTFTAKNGVKITDEMLDRWAEAYESGNLPGKGREIVVGRPRLSDEELISITFKMPKSRLTKLDTTAKQLGETRSEFLRATVEQALECV
ncbi:MAG: hypothetical protein RR794_01765, partial [Raoultibacter sp.]